MLGLAVRPTSRKILLSLAVQGIILAVHWVTFFYSIQVSTVAVGLISFSTFPIFVTFLAPLLFGGKIRGFDVTISIVIFLGLLLVAPEFKLENDITRGIIWGTLSGLTFALLSLLNKKIANLVSPIVIAYYQNLVASIVLAPFAFRYLNSLSSKSIVLLFILGVGCTAFAHTMFIKSLQSVRPQIASITACLEPVYGIIFAYIFLNEAPTLRMMVGGGIILSITLLASLREQPFREAASKSERLSEF
nr:DMT family transporter [Brasilonema sp. UFV-L1]